jgi:hypothetical protein
MPRMTRPNCPAHNPSKFDGPLSVILWERSLNGDHGDISGSNEDWGEGFEAWTDGGIYESVREVRQLVCRDCARDIVEAIGEATPNHVPYLEWDFQGFVYAGFTSAARALEISEEYDPEG